MARKTNREYLARRLLLVADHSSNVIPPELGSLGLTDEELTEHIAWDIGTDALTRALRDTMGGRAYFGAVSRLVVDVNRELDHPGLIAEDSDGVRIPGNVDLTDYERGRRIQAHYHPYHDGLAAEVDVVEATSRGAILIAVHSFTPRLRLAPHRHRPWQVGVLYNRDARLATKALDWLRDQPGLTVGDNEPYSGKALNHTMNRHAENRGLPYVSLEYRNDMLATPDSIRMWAALTANMLWDIL